VAAKPQGVRASQFSSVFFPAMGGDIQHGTPVAMTARDRKKMRKGGRKPAKAKENEKRGKKTSQSKIIRTPGFKFEDASELDTKSCKPFEFVVKC
jgi:hypothetical protein